MTTTTRTQALTYQQKIELRLESPHLRRPRPIAVILIECLIDGCIKQVQQWVRGHQMKQKVTATIQTQQSLTYQQKIELRLESPHLRRPRPIVMIRIEFPID